MIPARLIDNLRQGHRPGAEDLADFAQGLGDGSVSDGQAGAFAMAVCLQGLGEAGRVALTRGMRDSGQVLSWDSDRPVLDKHSTGGVGDAVSLILAPMLAACGVVVPMISGRGLGHTGGTLDKLEAVPGLRTGIPVAEFQDIALDVGCAIVAATPDIAPADRRLYGIRDVTGTVQSVDLITASILSKKLAAGLGGLVLDVKVGSGAIMKTRAEADPLARALVDTANGAGCPTSALMTDMSQPLLPALGNAIEIAESLAILKGRPSAMAEVALALGAELLVNARVEADHDAAEARLKSALRSGTALEVFHKMLRAQGASPGWELPIAPVVQDVPAPQSGVITGLDGTALGHVVVDLGGGRKVQTDSIDPAVGIDQVQRIGTQIDKGTPLARVYARDADTAQAMADRIAAAFTFGDKASAPELILGRVA